MKCQLHDIGLCIMLSQAKRNYSTTEREALGMICSVTKFRHYLLGRKFSFHVHHSALLYLVSKASLTHASFFSRVSFFLFLPFPSLLFLLPFSHYGSGLYRVVNRPNTLLRRLTNRLMQAVDIFLFIYFYYF